MYEAPANRHPGRSGVEFDNPVLLEYHSAVILILRAVGIVNKRAGIP
jgi:hypothetical protein